MTFDSAADDAPYTHLAAWYDAVYAARGKDYEAEASWITERWPNADSLLDVGCGTGEHLRYLALHYHVAGVDLHDEMIRLARLKLPGVPLTQAPMTSMNLDRTFDLVTCLFAAAAYLPDEAALTSALERFAAHTAPGGHVLVEPSVLPDEIQPPQTQRDSFLDHGQPVTRTTTAQVDGNQLMVTFTFEHGEERRTVRETHTFSLFSREAYQRAFEAAGLTVRFERPGPGGRGLFIGERPA